MLSNSCEWRLYFNPTLKVIISFVTLAVCQLTQQIHCIRCYRYDTAYPSCTVGNFICSRITQTPWIHPTLRSIACIPTPSFGDSIEKSGFPCSCYHWNVWEYLCHFATRTRETINVAARCWRRFRADFESRSPCRVLFRSRQDRHRGWRSTAPLGRLCLQTENATSQRNMPQDSWYASTLETSAQLTIVYLRGAIETIPWHRVCDTQAPRRGW